MKKLFSKFLLFVLLLAIFLPFGQVVSSETIASTASSAPQSTELSSPSVPEATSIEPPQSTVVQQTQTTSSAAVKQESQQSSSPEIQPKKEQTTVNTTQSTSPPVQSKEKSEQQAARLQLVKEPTPSISIDFVNEQLIGFDSTGNYQVNYGARIETVSGQTAFPITDDMMSKVWRIKKMGNGITTEDSDQQQLTIPGRAKLPEDWIQAFDETVQGKNDGKLQGVNQEYEYRLNGGAWTKGTPGGLVENLAPGTYEIRIANGRQFVSSPIVKTIKAALPKHAAPNITIDYEEELLQGFDQNGTYDVYFDGTNSKTITGQTEMKISEDMFGKGWRIVRKGDGLSIQDSDSQQLSVNHRRILYDSHIKAIPESAHGDNDGQLEGVDPEMEYRLAGASTWTNGPPNRIVKGLAPGDYDVRYEGSNPSKKFASVIVKKTIQAGLPREATPSITIDYEAEKLAGFDATSTYEIAFGSDKRTITGQTSFTIAEDMFGKGWKIVKVGDGTNTQNSQVQSLTIPGRQSLYPEMVTAIDESAQGENDGKLQGVRLDREYREVGDQNWMKGTNSGTVENLSPGDYEIRYYGSNQNKKFASLPVKKTIQAGLPREATPSITIDYEAEKLAGFDAVSTYEITFGSDKRTITGQTNFAITEDMFGKGWKIVKVGDGTNTQNSKVQSLTIPGRQSLYPEMVTAIDESAQGENDGKLQGVRLDREYREVGDQNWMKGTNSGTVENLSPGDYEIRYYGSNQNKKFASLPVKKTIQAGLPREATPSITIDYEAEKLAGFDAVSTYEITFGSDKRTITGQTNFVITEDMFGKGWKIVKVGDGTNTQNSQVQSLTIPWRQSLYPEMVTAIDESAQGENDGKLQGVRLDREYREVGDQNWMKGTNSGTVENLSPGDYEIRYYGSNQNKKFASLSVMKTIQAGLPREALPTIVIDYEKELLTGFLATAKYEISYASTIISVENKTEIPITEAMMNGNTWQIIQKASDTTKLDSKPLSLTIPKRQILSADAVKAIDESVIGKSDGQLQGVLPTMAYRSVKNSDWMVGVQDGVIRNLAPGDYEIRERANNQQQNFSSTALIKTIKQGSPEPEQHYVVTFDSNGGSKVDSQKVEKGERLKEPQKPTRKGYTFGGWFSDQELRQVWDFAEPISSDITLYAKWVLEQKETSTTNSTVITTEVTTTSSTAAGKPAGSTTKKTEQQKAAQNQTAKQYLKANDQASNSYWVGMGLVLLGAAGFLLRRTRKFNKS